MISRKKIKSSRYIAAFAITLLIFLVGYTVSTQINKNKTDTLSYLEQDLRADSLSNELLLQMIQTDTCDSINITAYTTELATYGQRITYLESIHGFSSPEIIRLKNYYSLLEIRHWMLSDALNKKCETSTSNVLYFYSNYKCEDCEDQGLVLTNVHRNYPFFNIYSFEYTINNSVIAYLKTKYSIQQNRLPAVVIDGEVYYGFQSKEALMKIMNLDELLAEDKLAHPESY